MSSFDVSKFYLGTLCKRQHNFEDTEKSLRYIKGGSCKECECNRRDPEIRRQYNQSYYHRNRSKILEDKKQYHQENREHILQQKKSYRQKNLERILKSGRNYYWNNKDRLNQANREYRTANHQRILLHNRNYYRENAEFCRQISRDYRKRHPEVARQGRQRYYARKAKCVHEPFTVEQLRSHIAKWAGSCAYCGSFQAKTLDHLVSISKQGAHALSNLVPACQSCNSSKQEFDAWDWYTRQPFYSLDRWQKIQQILEDCSSYQAEQCDRPT